MTLGISQKTADIDHAAEVAAEGDSRGFARRDGAKAQGTPEADIQVAADNVVALLQKIAESSTQGIDRLIVDLQTISDLLHDEGARVQREVAKYAHLSQSALQSTKIITESLGKWKNAGAWSQRPMAH
jgi:hypothetical protein